MNKKGFSLIELLTVISIISLLSSVMLGSFMTSRKKALVTAFKEETRNTWIGLIEICSERQILSTDIAPTYHRLQGLVDSSTNCGPGSTEQFAVNFRASAFGVNCWAGVFHDRIQYPAFGNINDDCDN